MDTPELPHYVVAGRLDLTRRYTIGTVGDRDCSTCAHPVALAPSSMPTVLAGVPILCADCLRRILEDHGA